MNLDIVSVITIDGPASSGKGTVAKLVAKHLGWHYLDSGSIYRAIGFIAIERNLVDKNSQLGIDSDNSLKHLLDLVKNMKLSFDGDDVLLNDVIVSQKLRDEGVGLAASALAKIAGVRDAVLHLQRSFAKTPGLVTDGRDMGSVVFPNAKLKVFLTASAEVRAQRRYAQLHALGKDATIADILRDIVARDEQDSTRKAAPLKCGDEFVRLDNSKLTVAETVAKIVALSKQAFG